ncbi:MAG: PAS domain-containing hybrid sensor histidine kinase/response regulator [Rhodoferax sp.]
MPLPEPYPNAASQPAPPDAGEPGQSLRLQAEHQLRELSQAPSIAAAKSPQEMQLALHELQVYQTELLIQNEHLRQTQIALEASWAHYADFYDMAPVGYLTLNEKGLIQSANLTAASLLGVTRSNLVKQAISRFIFPQDRATFYQCLRQLGVTCVPQSLELRLIRQDGRPLWVLLVAHNAVDADDGPVQRLVLSDISERKQLQTQLADSERRWQFAVLQTQLADSERRWQFAVEGSGDGLWDRNVVQGTVFYSRTWKQMLGHGEDEVSNRIDEWETRIHPDDKPATMAALQAYLAGTCADYKTEYRLRCRDGSYKWILDRGMVVSRDAQGKPLRLIGTHSDITEGKLHEAQIKAARLSAEAANRAKSRFLAAASHDLRQPLSALALFVGVLKARTAPQAAELVANIEQCVDSLSELLTDLLDVSRLDAGAITPRLGDFDLKDFLAALDSVHAGEARNKGLQWRVRGAGLVVHTDQQLLKRIVGNLVSNAIRYTNQGGVLMTCRRRAGKYWLEVWDTGIGIPEDKKELIFEEFRQLGDGARNQGSGLGLAIASKMANLLGLQIRVCSRLGRGSMFAIELPAGRPERLGGASLPAAPAGRILRIGLIEDNPLVLQALTVMLESIGHTVVAALSGHELLQRLGQHRPDLLVSDYRLADRQTGFDVIEATRAVFGADLPAILITGDTDPALIRSMECHAIAVHYKPMTAAAFQAAIASATERRAS